MTDAWSLDELQQATRRHWRQVALSTKPIDKAKAASVVDRIYKVATGRPPAYVLFFDSPLQAEIAATCVTRIVREAIGKDDVGCRPWDDLTNLLLQVELPVRSTLDATYRALPDIAVLNGVYNVLSNQFPLQARKFFLPRRSRHRGRLRIVKLSADWSRGLRPWLAWAAYQSFQRAAFRALLLLRWFCGLGILFSSQAMDAREGRAQNRSRGSAAPDSPWHRLRAAVALHILGLGTGVREDQWFLIRFC